MGSDRRNEEDELYVGHHQVPKSPAIMYTIRNLMTNAPPAELAPLRHQAAGKRSTPTSPASLSQPCSTQTADLFESGSGDTSTFNSKWGFHDGKSNHSLPTPTALRGVEWVNHALKMRWRWVGMILHAYIQLFPALDQAKNHILGSCYLTRQV